MNKEDYLLKRLFILENVVEQLGKVLCGTAPAMQSMDMTYLGEEWNKANIKLDEEYAEAKKLEEAFLRTSETK